MLLATASIIFQKIPSNGIRHGHDCLYAPFLMGVKK